MIAHRITNYDRHSQYECQQVGGWCLFKQSMLVTLLFFLEGEAGGGEDGGGGEGVGVGVEGGGVVEQGRGSPSIRHHSKGSAGKLAA